MGKFYRHTPGRSLPPSSLHVQAHVSQKHEQPARQSISKSITSRGWLVHEGAGTALKTGISDHH